MIFLLRCVLLSLYFVVIAVLGVVICLFRPFNADNNRVLAQLFSVGGIKILGIELEIRGEEILKEKTPGVILSNHQSNLDLYVLGSVVPYRTVSIGKSSLKWIPFFGQLYWLAGNVMIDRTNASQSIDAMDQVRQAIDEDGRTIWVFPEGTRNGGRGLSSFKKGAFHIALQAQCPIYPVAASTYAGRLKLNEWRSGKVIISVMPGIETKGLTSDDLDDLLYKTHAQIADEIGRNDALIEKPVDED